MFNSEVRGLLVEVVSSWQVLAATVVLVIYIFLINRVAKPPPRRPPKPPRAKKVKQEAADVPIVTEDEDLGLEEEAEE